MIRKSKLFKAAVLLGSIIGIMGAAGCAANNTKELSSTDVTFITKVLPYGEVGYAMVCDFGTKVESSKLSQSSFQVETTIGDKTEPRKITKVYTNDSIATTEKPKDGRYIVIELDPEDKNASTFTFNEAKFLNTRNDLKYTVVQKADIKTKDGITFKASDNKVKASKEVTPVVDDFKKSTYSDAAGNKLNYRFFEPKTESGKKYPLVLFLHGSGERGSDNAMHLLGNEGALVWAAPEQQAKNPAYVLAPQAPVTDKLTAYWTEEPNYSLTLSLLKETIKKYAVDTNRIYVVGMSNGGIGTWNMIEKNPNLFAAAVPICGVGDINSFKIGGEYEPLKDYSAFKDIKNMSIWIFHAEDDPLVDVRYSRDAVKAIKELGGTSIKYTEYPKGTIKPMGHFSWVPALENKEMIDWLFAQSKQ